MKKKFLFILSIAILSLGSFQSCDYLNIVPDEIPTSEDAFANPNAALKFVYSCYGYIPNPRGGAGSLDFLTADEVVTAFEHEDFAKFPKGNFTPSNPVISYWNTLFAGIRQCYILLNNVDTTPNLDPSLAGTYKAEATFLLAYYHYLLLKSYGPIILITSEPDITMSPADFPARANYDQCVQWIANKFDEAVAMGLLDNQSSVNYGRATSVAAKAIKARMYLYAASPLFNGGKSSVADTDDISSFLQGFVDKDGNQLISTVVSREKWEKAAAANLEAIKAAEAAGHALYVDDDNRVPEPADPIEKRLRLVVGDRYTTEIIFADTRKENTYDLQNKSTPYSNKTCWNGIAPTLNMLETFYTKNGLPIDVDPSYDYTNRYSFSEQANGLGKTLNLNQDREPRFNAWVAFHNGEYELLRYVGNNQVNKIKVQFRKNDNCGIQERNNNYSPTGYLNKKGVHPSYSRQEGKGGNFIDYPWPLVRLAELYLNYAEALVELNQLNEAKVYIDKVRLRAGLNDLDATWAPTGLALDQNRMREIVRQERSIELYLENHRFWDVRRWLLGSKYFNVKAKGMNIAGTTDEAFFKVKEVDFQRVFQVPTHYLMPIPQKDIDINDKLVQNPGY